MNLDHLHLDPSQRAIESKGIKETSSPSEISQPLGSKNFQELLESLQRIRLTGQESGDPESNLLDLSDALEKADKAHRKVMDLSKQLESAYQRALGKRS